MVFDVICRCNNICPHSEMLRQQQNNTVTHASPFPLPPPSPPSLGSPVSALLVLMSTSAFHLQQGLVINIGSVASLSPMPKTAVYATSKWGLRGWSLSCYEVSSSHLTSHCMSLTHKLGAGKPKKSVCMSAHGKQTDTACCTSAIIMLACPIACQLSCPDQGTVM